VISNMLLLTVNTIDNFKHHVNALFHISNHRMFPVCYNASHDAHICGYYVEN